MLENDFKSFEFEGGCVEDAIKNALAKFNLKREDVIIKVLTEEKKGLFGMEGSKPAKIMVSAKKKRKS